MEHNFNTEQLTLIAMLGHTVSLYDSNGQLLVVGTLSTPKPEPKAVWGTKDNYVKGKNAPRTLKYWHVTAPWDGQNCDQWVMRYDEIKMVDGDSYKIVTVW